MSTIDCTTGKANARYWVPNLIHDHFAPCDKLVGKRRSGDIDAQTFVTAKRRAVLLINKRNTNMTVRLKNMTVRLKKEWKNGIVSVVDSGEMGTSPFSGSVLELARHFLSRD